MERDKGALDDSFAEFVQTRGEHHRRLAILLAGDWHAGEDLIQASLLRLYEAWPRLDTTTGADAYLHKIMVNQHRSWRRTKWRGEMPGSYVPDAGSPDDPADQQATGAVIRAALTGLPYKQRAALVLRYFADLSEAETATILGCSAGSVKTHTSRGVHAMRERLGSEFGRSCHRGGAAYDQRVPQRGVHA
jgi:RNA polymerase sigma-70 factor (sigma-E family)